MYRLYLMYSDGEEFMDALEYDTEEEAKEGAEREKELTNGDLIGYYVYEC